MIYRLKLIHYLDLRGGGALQTTAQTLIGGINELNSKFLPLTGGIITGGVEIQGNLIAHGHKLAFRHLDAGLDWTDCRLYLGYGVEAPTKSIGFYTSNDTSSRTQQAEINSSGLLVNTGTTLTQFPIYKNIVHCEVCYVGSGGGDQTFTGEVPFDNVRQNIGNAWNTSTHRFVCPYTGLYFVTWQYFSNVYSNATGLRPTIYVNGSMRTMIDIQPACLSAIFYLSAGNTISAGFYLGTGSFYRAWGHNLFQVSLIQRAS